MEKNATPIENAKLSYLIANVVKEKNGSFSYSESVDYREPVTRKLAKNELHACFLFNSMSVAHAARLFQFTLEQNQPITPNRMEGAARLTVTAKLPTTITSYFDFVALLKPEELAKIAKAASDYMTDWNGGVSLASLLINDGTFKAGQLIRSTSPSLTGQVGIVVTAAVQGPVTVLYGKLGGVAMLDQLLAMDKNEVIDEALLPANMVAKFIQLHADFVAKMAKDAETFANRHKEKADKKAKADKKKATADTKRNDKNAAKSDETKAKEDPASKRSPKYVVDEAEMNIIKKTHRAVSIVLHPDKHSQATEEVQKYVGEMMAKANGFKDKNNLPGLNGLLTEVQAYLKKVATPEPEPATEPAKAAPKAKAKAGAKNQPTPTPSATNEVAVDTAAPEAEKEAE